MVLILLSIISIFLFKNIKFKKSITNYLEEEEMVKSFFVLFFLHQPKSSLIWSH